MWQSGVEISRILALRWADLEGIDGRQGPLKLQFFGRKRHKRPYHTFLGRDSMEALKLWREKWAELVRRQPSPQDLVFLGKRGGGLDRAWLIDTFRKMALRLGRQSIVKNCEPSSWHSHMLRARAPKSGL